MNFSYIYFSSINMNKENHTIHKLPRRVINHAEIRKLNSCIFNLLNFVEEKVSKYEIIRILSSSTD